MDKVFTIAYREFMYNLRRPAFLFAVFGTPLIIIVALVLSIGLIDSGPDLSEYGTVGYVDSSAAQVLAPGEPLEDYPDLFTRYESKEAADEAADVQRVEVRLDGTAPGSAPLAWAPVSMPGPDVAADPSAAQFQVNLIDTDIGVAAHAYTFAPLRRAVVKANQRARLITVLAHPVCSRR